MEPFETSPTTAKLDAALAKAQGEIEAAVKDKENPAFRSRYADLSAVWEACRVPLAKHGISITQWPVHSDDNRLHLVTRVAHDGEWMRAVSSIPSGKPDAHGYGSAITYAKRYALCAAVGVVADEDDDGNAASAKAEPVRRQRASRPEPTQPAPEPAGTETHAPHTNGTGGPSDPPASDKQTGLVESLAKSSLVTEEERDGIRRRLLHGMTKRQASDAIEWLQKVTKERKEAAVPA